MLPRSSTPLDASSGSTALDLERTYRTYGHSVLRRARSILGNDADAADVLQDVFASLVDRPEQFGGAASLVTFLYRMTTNLCLNRIRNRNNRDRLIAQHVEPALPTTAGPRAGDTVVVRELLDQMPDDLARATIHHFVDGMTHDEVAAHIGCSPRHVRNLIMRARDWVAAEGASR